MLGYLGVAIAASLWGTFSLFFRHAERAQAAAGGKLAPATEAFVVFLVVFLAVAPFGLRDARRRAARRPLSAWGGILFTGIGDALNALLFFWAMQTTSLAVAVLSHYLAPVLVAVAAPFAVGEHMKRATWVALFCALAGLALLLEPWQASAGPAASALAGAALGAGSAVFYAANLLVFKRIQHHFSPLEVLAWHMPPALVVLLLCVPAGGFSLTPPALGLLLAAGLVPGAIAGVLFLRGLARVPASRASVLTLFEPLVAVLVGVLVWHERPSPVAALGALLVLAGAWLVLRSEAPERALA